MFAQVDTRNPAAVENEVQSVYRSLFPGADDIFVPQIFYWAMECFTGLYPGYQPIDTLYHDFEHTLQGVLCMARILEGRHLAGEEPALSQRMFELGLLAILLHDTGYLKQIGDRSGTGAKYTLVHVSRSIEFSGRLLKEKGFPAEEIRSVQNMIRCTGINVDLSGIPFQNETEKLTGFALGTADLLGQMAADDYIEKLPVLYGEFAESQQYNRETINPKAVFASADDLMRKTPLFWSKYVQPKINDDFLGLYRFLNRPIPDGPNEYLAKVEENLRKLETRLQVA